MSRPFIELALSPPPFDGTATDGVAFYDVLVDGHRYKAFSIKPLHDAKLMVRDLAENFEKLGLRAYVSPDVPVPEARHNALAHRKNPCSEAEGGFSGGAPCSAGGD